MINSKSPQATIQNSKLKTQNLPNDFFVQQFLDQTLDVCVAACECLAFLSLEHDVLDSLHLGR